MKFLGFWILPFICLMIFVKSTAQEEPHIVCYYKSKGNFQPVNAQYNPENIDPYLCTHLIYSHGGFTLEDNTLQPLDNYRDIENGGYAKFNGLKTINKNLKTLISIGSWNEGSTKFSSLIRDALRRRTFIKNAIIFLRRYKFDGLDLYWIFPWQYDHYPEDYSNSALFVQELREEFDRESLTTEISRLLLTVVISSDFYELSQVYDVIKLNQYIDWFNVLSIDYSSLFQLTHHYAPLYSLEEGDKLNIDFTIKHLISSGADRQKILLGIATYGYSFKLSDPDVTEVGSPIRVKSVLTYSEICQNIKNDDNWVVKHPNDNVTGPYMYKDDQWISYDDENIARKKGQYAENNWLGGIVVWSIGADDWNGTCSGKPYPIIKAAKKGLDDVLKIKKKFEYY